MLKDLSNGLASIRSLFLIESCHAFHLSQSEKTSELGLPRYPEMTPMPYTEPWCNFYHFIYLYFLFFSFYLHKKKKSCSTLYGDWLSLLWKTLHFVNSLYIVNADVLTSILCSCKTRVGDLRLLGDPSGGKADSPGGKPQVAYYGGRICSFGTQWLPYNSDNVKL